MNFICNFELSWYPFDTQHCYMNISLEGNSAIFVDLGILFDCLQTLANLPSPVAGDIAYDGPIDLSQYYIKVKSR